jgi:hypothetical protein
MSKERFEGIEQRHVRLVDRSLQLRILFRLAGLLGVNCLLFLALAFLIPGAFAWAGGSANFELLRTIAHPQF